MRSNFNLLNVTSKFRLNNVLLTTAETRSKLESKLLTVVVFFASISFDGLVPNLFAMRLTRLQAHIIVFASLSCLS